MRDEEAANVQGLIDRAALASGRPPLSDQLLADWQAGAGITLTEPSDPGARVTGLAQASPRGEGWTIEVVVDADSDDPRAGKRRLAERVMQAVAEAGGGTTDWWVFDATAEDDRLAGKLGFAIDRDLRQMSRRLPTERSSSVVTRPFVVGQDEEAWLAVNNRAFAGHAEQGGWTIETLRGRFALAWFDPAGFLLHERDGVLAAFCWTKLHSPVRCEATPAPSSTQDQAAEFRGEDPVRCEATPAPSSTQDQAAEFRGEDPVRCEATPAPSSTQDQAAEFRGEDPVRCEATPAPSSTQDQAAEFRGEDPVRCEATPAPSSTQDQAAEFRGEDPVRCEATPGASSTEGKIGEIYVIGVDPEFQGLGLGSQLTLAGLESLHARGADEGMLYVDGANRAAQSMYERLGFAVTRRDRAYRRDIAPAGARTK